MRWFAILTVVVGFAVPHGISARADAGQITAALFGAAVLWLIIADRLDATKQSSLLARNGDNTTVLDWIDAGVVPLILFFQATSAIEPLASRALVEGLGAAVLLLFALRRELRPRATAAAACAILAVAAVFQLKLEGDRPPSRAARHRGRRPHREQGAAEWVVDRDERRDDGDRRFVQPVRARIATVVHVHAIHRASHRSPRY
jgi:hypothetical protein